VDKFSALSDPTRRSILQTLAESGPLAASEICRLFPVSPSAISQHLKILREADLVMLEKRGQQRIYRINPSAVLELEDWAKQIKQLWSRRFDALENLIQEEKEKLAQIQENKENKNVSN
jgi:DNA-binding transcriptional ArsR family regulator